MYYMALLGLQRSIFRYLTLYADITVLACKGLGSFAADVNSDLLKQGS